MRDVDGLDWADVGEECVAMKERGGGVKKTRMKASDEIE